MRKTSFGDVKEDLEKSKRPGWSGYMLDAAPVEVSSMGVV